MKKSQVLATLALAFALGLGVVAPVANTYAVDVQARTATGSNSSTTKVATAEDLNKAISSIESNNTYSAYAKLIEAVNNITDAKVTDADAATAYASADAAVAALQSAMGTLKIAYNTDDSLNVLLTKAQGGDYAKWAAVIDATAAANKSDKTATDGIAFDNLFNAIKAIDGNFTVDEGDTVQDLITFASNTTANQGLNNLNNSTTATLTNYTSLYNAVKKANETYKLDDAIRTALKSGYISGVKVSSIKPESTLTQLSTIATSLSDYGAWEDVYEAVEDAKDVDLNTKNPTEIYQMIDNANPKGLLQLMQEATDNEDLTVADLLGGASTPVTTITITSADKNITVTGKLPAGTEVKVKKSDNKVAAFGDRKYGMWDITLVNAKGETVTFEGNLTVTIKVPEGINGEKAGVYFADAKGNVQKYASTYKDGALTFTTNHLSLWAIVEDNGETITTPKSPDTGIVANEGNASTTVAMVAGLATALTAAGAGVVAYRNARRSTRK